MCVPDTAFLTLRRKVDSWTREGTAGRERGRSYEMNPGRGREREGERERERGREGERRGEKGGGSGVKG